MLLRRRTLETILLEIIIPQTVTAMNDKYNTYITRFGMLFVLFWGEKKKCTLKYSLYPSSRSSSSLLSHLSLNENVKMGYVWGDYRLDRITNEYRRARQIDNQEGKGDGDGGKSGMGQTEGKKWIDVLRGGMKKCGELIGKR